MKSNCYKTLPALVAAVLMTVGASAGALAAKKPNIIMIFGDDIGQDNISAYHRGMLDYDTPNIDRIA
ncbi:MAG: arylsulfatase, partial [Gammaproteobacteria bacterium]